MRINSKTDLEEILETPPPFFLRASTYLFKERKPVARIKINDQHLETYLVAVLWHRTRHRGLCDSPNSVNIKLEPKSQKRNLIQWSTHEAFIHGKLGDRNSRSLLLFHPCAEFQSVHIVLLEAWHTIQCPSRMHQHFVSEWKVLSHGLAGLSPITLRLGQRDWHY